MIRYAIYYGYRFQDALFAGGLWPRKGGSHDTDSPLGPSSKVKMDGKVQTGVEHLMGILKLGVYTLMGASVLCIAGAMGFAWLTGKGVQAVKGFLWLAGGILLAAAGFTGIQSMIS